MNVAAAHLMLVHVPVVGCLGVAIIFSLALWLASELLWKLGYGLLIASAGVTVLAYFTGEPSYELLEAGKYEVAQSDVTQHALVARGALIGMLLVAAFAANAVLQYAQGERPARWLNVTLLVSTLLISYVLAWTAHLGGLVRHPELREPPLRAFPELPE